MEVCPHCSHPIFVPNYCEYCQMYLMQTRVLGGFDKRSASGTPYFDLLRDFYTFTD